MLAFRAWTAIAAVTAAATSTAAFAAVPATAAAPPPPASAALTFAPWIAATVLAAFARSAIAAVAATTTAALAAVSATTAVVAGAIAIAAGIAFGGAARRGFSGLAAAEKSFQPAHEPAGFFRGLGARGAVLIRLIRARLEASIVATRLARFARIERTTFAAFTWLAAFARIAAFSRIATFSLFARFAPVARFTAFARFKRPRLTPLIAAIARLEGRPFVTPRRTGVSGSRGSGGGLRFPMERRSLGLLGRQDLELGLWLRRGRTGAGGQGVGLRRVAGGSGAFGASRRVQRCGRFRNRRSDGG